MEASGDTRLAVRYGLYRRRGLFDLDPHQPRWLAEARAAARRRGLLPEWGDRCVDALDHEARTFPAVTRPRQGMAEWPCLALRRIPRTFGHCSGRRDACRGLRRDRRTCVSLQDLE